MAVSLQSYNEILGKLIRKMIADTPANDISTGSVLLTLLEAVAAQDFENNLSILSVLETLNIDALKNLDLDVRAADYGLSRKTATNATGFIKISDSSFTKRSTTLYAVKPSPIAGDFKIFVNNADGWGTLNTITGKRSGTVYIGRGTQQFEGPIPYYDIIDNGTFFEIRLGSNELNPTFLQKDHLSSDSVVDGQGTVDRLIPAGFIVKIPSNNLTPEIKYSILRDVVIPAGEDSISDVPIVAEQPGISGNAGLNTITNFESLPFTNAKVTNTSVLLDGRDTESDDDLRERIKSYSSTLSRGTRASILSAIIGVSDSTDGKQVSSAVIQESIVYGEPSIVYVDDGSGFQPSTQGQSVDILLASAAGGEQFLQLSNFPVPRPQILNQVSGPLELAEGMRLVVAVDDEEQEIIFSSSSFNNIAAATLIEIVVAINDQANYYNYNFRCRLAQDSTRLLIYPTKFDAEFIQVIGTLPNGLINANSVLSFPTNSASYISLYRNNTLLRSQETAATLTTLQSPWTSLVSNGNLILSVDGTPPQDATFTPADFGGSPISSISPAQWASAMNLKFAGVTASATSNGKIQIASNKVGATSSLEVIGGSYVDDWFSGLKTSATGSSADFILNRQTGNIKLTSPAEVGDSITAGNQDSKGYILTAPTNTGTYDLTEDGVGRPSEMVVVADGFNVETRQDIVRTVGTGFKVQVVDTDKMRIVCQSAGTFQKARVGDYVYIAFKSKEVPNAVVEPKWFQEKNTGLFKIVAKGAHTNVGVNTYVDVVNKGAVAEPDTGWFSLSLDNDIQVFGSDAYPQIWRSSYVSDTNPITLQEMIDSLESDLINVKGSFFKTNMDKFTSSTENNGSIAVPVSIGKLSFIVDTAQNSQLGNQSHIATRITSTDMLTWFKRGAYTQRDTSSNTLLPDRSRYSDISGVLTLSAEPGVNPEYAENITSSIFTTTGNNPVNLDDVVNITSGSNKSLFRNITTFTNTNEIGTRKSTPYTTFDYLVGDGVEILKPMSFASDDSVVFVMDGDAVNKTINVNFWRTGKVNSELPPSNSQFSADDADNESDVNFSSQTVWSTLPPISTNFEDYAVWFRSRNWYRSGGVASSDGTLIIRAKEYGPIGDSHRFNIEYPSSPNLLASVNHKNNPEYTTTTYIFGSGSKRTTGIGAGTSFKISKVNTLITTAQNDPTNPIQSGDWFRLPGTSTDGVVFWYAVNNSGSEPSAPGRKVKINTVNTGDTAEQVAQKTQIAIDNDSEFSATVVGNTITYLNNFTTMPSGTWGQSGIAFTQNADTKRLRYTFFGNVNLETVLIGDVISIADTSVSNIYNSGTFSILNVSNDGKYIDVYNPNGSPTNVGRPDKVDIAGVKNAGVKMVQKITTTKQGAAADEVSSGDYFILYDQSGSVVFWYDVDAGGTVQPEVVGAGRFVKINTVNTSDSAITVAQKTSAIVGADPEFTTAYTSGNNYFDVTNNFIGVVNAGSSGTGLTFGFTTNTPGADDTIGGKYFKLYDGLTSTVAVWFNVEGEPIPPHGCDRAIQVILEPGDTASTVASKLALAVDADPQFTASSNSTNVTIFNYNNGQRGTAVDGASPYNTGFSSILVTQTGQNDEVDASSSSNGVLMYPLLQTDAASIANTINTSQTITAAVKGSTSATITKATREELLPVGYSHNINNGYISLFDGSSLVRAFYNSNPNFVLKSSLLLQGQQPSIYDMATCPNPNSSEVGEFFKLIPKTIKNVKHHLTHKALSQLPIVADIDIASNFRKIQVKSKKLGTQGAVEIVGGRANVGELNISSTASVLANDSNNKNYLTLTTQAYPNTFCKNDVVKIYNTLPAKRKFNPDSSVTVEVKNDTNGNISYYINSREFNYSPFTKWTISDVSSSYGLTGSGVVWRWLHEEAGAKAYIHGYVTKYDISSIQRTGGVATVTTASAHTLELGQKIIISGVVDVPSFNGEYTVLSPSTPTFTFTSPGNDVYSAGGFITIIATQTVPVKAYPSSGTTELTDRLRAYDFSVGSTESPFNVNLTVDSLPDHGDYFLITGPNFQSPPGSTPTFAVWFAKDGNTTEPVGAPYIPATYKIKVDILSADTPNTIVDKLSNILVNDTNFKKYISTRYVSGTTLTKVKPGDVLNAWTSDASWPMGNQSQICGSSKIAGLPILAVNATSRYMDVINPNGRVMSTGTYPGTNGGMVISPSIATRFRLKHRALSKITKIVGNGTTAVATTEQEHGFSVGDLVRITESDVSITNPVTITATSSPVEFSFNSTYTGTTLTRCNCILENSVSDVTRYRISSLGFKNLFKIECTQGASPYFAKCGVAVDDFIELSGDTFKANNRGRFRILAVNDNSVIISNPNGVEELDSYRPINYAEKKVQWTYGSNVVTGSLGSFNNVSVGDWIRSVDDGDEAFVQVLNISSGPLLASVTLGQNYAGSTSESEGVFCNFQSDVGKGAELKSTEDIKIYECDATVVGDKLVIDSITNSNWFNNVNSGVRATTDWGTDATSRRQYVTVRNVGGISQEEVRLDVRLDGMYLLENDSYLYETMRRVENTSISRFNSDQRIIYATPDDRTYKMSSDYGTKIQSMGKMDFPLSSATGIDGYLYYVGLMRTVQRVIDGYEPDSSTYPGRRAVGSTIELLPPLIKKISMVLKIATRDGVNLNDVTNDIKSTIINYVASLGVGEDVVLSEVIRRVKNITGIDAVTFTSPVPSEERISVNDNEKALTSPDLISLS